MCRGFAVTWRTNEGRIKKLIYIKAGRNYYGENARDKLLNGRFGSVCYIDGWMAYMMVVEKERKKKPLKFHSMVMSCPFSKCCRQKTNVPPCAKSFPFVYNGISHGGFNYHIYFVHISKIIRLLVQTNALSTSSLNLYLEGGSYGS